MGDAALMIHDRGNGSSTVELAQPSPRCINLSGPILIFGGPYSNLQATVALLRKARELGIAPDHIVCTGDLAAYCGSPLETIELVAASGCHVVSGNCDEQLATDSVNCGCGFPAGGSCEALSKNWFDYANRMMTTGARNWLQRLPKNLDLYIDGRKLRVVHGSPSKINDFIFYSDSLERKAIEIYSTNCDGIVAGHCGLPFTQLVGTSLWHNAGVIGMPANDGTPRTWFSTLTPVGQSIHITHHPLEYDYKSAAAAMRRAGLGIEYRQTLLTGLWPSCEVLPDLDRSQQGIPLQIKELCWI
jgi:predicted phosphodiesterase